MNCRNIENNLIGYIENTLPEDFSHEMDLHLQNCLKCKNLVLQVQSTYLILDKPELNTPELFQGIKLKYSKHHTTVIEFIPRHRIIYRIAASVLIITGIGFGILLGGKFSTSGTSTSKTILEQSNLPDDYSSETSSMDNEPGLASLYSNE